MPFRYGTLLVARARLRAAEDLVLSLNHRGTKNTTSAIGVIVALVATAPLPAFAQSATPLERFSPVPAGDALFASPQVSAGGYLAVDAGLVLSYASSPLALRTQSIGTGEYRDSGTIVSHQAVLHAMVAASLFSRVKVDLDVPMTLDQSGDSPSSGGTTVLSPNGFAMNDLRIGARITAFEPEGFIPGAAVAFSAFLPTGNSDAFTSTGSARFEPRLIVGADYGRVVWSASVGRQLGDATGSLFASDVTFSAGVAARFGRFQVGPEIFGHAVVDQPKNTDSVVLSSRAGGGLEALLGAKAKLGPFALGAAGGLGFLRGVGTPDYRFVLQIGFRPFEDKSPPSEQATVQEGSNTISAQQVGGPKTATGPTAVELPVPEAPVDTDGDTVPDEKDACPKVVGDPRPEATKLGCPPDKDGDGIYDVDDKCPDRPGIVAEGDKNGCPPDTDGDGIADPDDACPEEAGPKTEDPKTNGCPAAVRVEGSQIVILQQVNFETAKAVILQDSFSILQQVVDVLTQHPEIARLAVDGHTDSRGAERSNLELSRARAVSVMKWLVDKGVDARRVEARGFGPRRPIADNKTPEGRAKNRRVEFQILKKTDKGEDGWFDGPVPE